MLIIAEKLRTFFIKSWDCDQRIYRLVLICYILPLPVYIAMIVCLLGLCVMISHDAHLYNAGLFACRVL